MDKLGAISVLFKVMLSTLLEIDTEAKPVFKLKTHGKSEDQQM